MPEQKFDEVIQDLKKKIYHPVYLFSGEEAFFIDELVDYLEEKVLSNSEKEFNQTVVYGLDSNVFDIIGMAKRFPMMSNYQLIVVKEAQNLEGIENLVDYLKSPLKSTILVLAYKHKSIDKRTVLYKQIKESGVVFVSAKLWDNQIASWIEKRIATMGFSINSNESELLANYLGADLAKIDNELKKMALNIAPGSKITDSMIEDNVGISKEYNIFELNYALAKRDVLRANRIVTYFAANSKEINIFGVLPNLHNFFFRTLVYAQIKELEPNKIASILNIKPSQLVYYQLAFRNYKMRKLVFIIHEIKMYDLKAKGLGNSTTNAGELLRELIFKILHD
jgi:DNA polymerase-3 subunit delta